MAQRIDVPGIGIVEFPDGMDDAQIAAAIKQNQTETTAAQPRGFVENAVDFAKSIPRGMVTGFTSLPNPNMALSGDEMASDMQGRARAAETVKAPLPVPQGPAGKFGEAIGEGLGNPLSYVGPGSAALKLGGSVLSSAGGEAGRQAAEGTAFEKPAQIAGALAGGTAGAKALGPGAPKAAAPTYRELKDAATSDYKAARASDLQLHPKGVSQFASKVEQELIGPEHGFTARDAPKTFAVLSDLEQSPARIAAAAKNDPSVTGSVSASDFDAIRKNLGRLSRETNEGKPTPEAAAASVALENLNKYTENIPQHHILAGNASDYVRATQQGNANYAAAQRVRVVDKKIADATRNTEGAIATSLDNQLKSQIRNSILNNPKAQRGWTPEELAAANKVNKGTVTSNILRQLGRGGSGVVPIGMQLAAAAPAAAATGGTSLIAQALLAAGLYGAKKTAEGMTKSRANDLAEMLAKRSPEYKSRAAPAPDNSPHQAALIRALLGAN
jgi:hypothetical protein